MRILYKTKTKIFKYSKIFLSKGLVFLMIASSLITFSCSIFDTPTGEAELLDVYVKKEKGYVEEYFSWGSDTDYSHTNIRRKTEEVLVSYLCTTVKITNTSDRTIYNSLINIQATAGDRTYYKSISLDITIAPGAIIYIPIEMEKETKELIAVNNDNDKEWDKDSIKIISVSWR